MNKKTNKRKIYVDPLLHNEVQYRFAMFLQDFPPREFNRMLRDVFIDYLVERGHKNVRIDLELMTRGIWDLMRVLDEAENHWEIRDTEEIIELYSGELKSK